MKRGLSSAAADRLAAPLPGAASALEVPLDEGEVLRVLARIARTAKPGDRLRAAELIGRQLGVFREQTERGVTLEQLVPRPG